MQRKWPSDRACLSLVRLEAWDPGSDQEWVGRGGRGGLGSGTGNLLCPRSPSQFSSAPPAFPLWDEGAIAGPPHPAVSPAPCSPAGSEHTAVADRHPVSKEHQGACHTRLRHPGVRPPRNSHLRCPIQKPYSSTAPFKPGANLPPPPVATSSPHRPPARLMPSP